MSYDTCGKCGKCGEKSGQAVGWCGIDDCPKKPAQFFLDMLARGRLAGVEYTGSPLDGLRCLARNWRSIASDPKFIAIGMTASQATIACADALESLLVRTGE